MSPKTYTQICNNTNSLINIASSKNTYKLMLLIEQLSTLIFIYIYTWSFRKSLRHICRKSSGTVISCLHQTHNIISYCLLNRAANIPITAPNKNPYIYIRPTAIGHVLICVRLWCDYHQSESMCIVQLNSEIIQPPTPPPRPISNRCETFCLKCYRAVASWVFFTASEWVCALALVLCNYLEHMCVFVYVCVCVRRMRL